MSDLPARLAQINHWLASPQWLFLCAAFHYQRRDRPGLWGWGPFPGHAGVALQPVVEEAEVTPDNVQSVCCWRDRHKQLYPDRTRTPMAAPLTLPIECATSTAALCPD